MAPSLMSMSVMTNLIPDEDRATTPAVLGNSLVTNSIVPFSRRASPMYEVYLVFGSLGESS